MWLNEIDDDHSAWINPETAAARSIGDGDRIMIKSRLGEIEAMANVTENVVPGAIAMSSHGGRWEYGRYASGKKAPHSLETDHPYEEHKWWSDDSVQRCISHRSCRRLSCRGSEAGTEHLVQ
jgi:anaerobic selenocysteine-containing dehydrogenase